MKKNGFTLLEVIIAIMLVLVGITGTFVLITKTMGVMAVSSSRLIAAYLSQEGIEIVRNIRDTNWLQNTSWDKGLASECAVTCECTTANGCVVDYLHSAQLDPDLPAYTDQVLNIDGNGFYSYSPGTVTKFKRKITIVSGSDILEVTVMVEWEEKGKAYSHTVQESLYNWR